MPTAGPALLMARLRVIARAQQQCGRAASGAAALAAAPLRGVSTTATATAPPAEQPRQATATTTMTTPSLPPGANPLLPAPHASAIATRLAAAGAFAAPPRSLSFDRGLYRYPESLEGNAIGRAVLRLTGSYSRRQTLRNGAVVLWDAIAELAPSNGGGSRNAAAATASPAGSSATELARAFGLDPRAFMTGWYLESLGVWLVVNRLKLEGRAEAADFQQHLYSHLYQPEVARRVRSHPGVVAPYSGKWLRRLEQVFYGMALAYDRAIVGGDGGGGGEPAPSSVGAGAGGAGGGGAGGGGASTAAAALSRALVRNVYGGDGAYAASADLLARYLCRQLQCLAMTPTEDLYLGQVRFGGLEGPREGAVLVVGEEGQAARR
jgi:hypothetical protein